MAESFSNYLTNKSYSSGNTQVIIPKANDNVPGGIGTRPANSITQVHSIYVCKEQTTKPDSQTDIETYGAYVNIYIIDANEQVETKTKFYIAHNVNVLPFSAFYIEKTITLTQSQSLNIEYTTLNGSTTNKITTICSCVDLT